MAQPVPVRHCECRSASVFKFPVYAKCRNITLNKFPAESRATLRVNWNLNGPGDWQAAALLFTLDPPAYSGWSGPPAPGSCYKYLTHELEGNASVKVSLQLQVPPVRVTPPPARVTQPRDKI